MKRPESKSVPFVGNATKHIAEYAAYKAENYTPEDVRLASQVQLSSFKAAVETAENTGLKYREVFNVDGWELMFAPAKTADHPFSIILSISRGENVKGRRCQRAFLGDD